jgi:hypothetical protein
MSRKQKKKMPKERNEFVFQLIQRGGAGGGAHQKTKKAIRRQDKIKLQKQDYYHKVA